jgi:nucleoside-diphosphate-sugar epimerase
MAERDGKYPITPYGVSKLIAEGIHEKWQVSAPGRSLRIIRPGVVFGPGDPGNMLRMIRAVKRGYFALPGDPKVKKSIAYIEGLLDSIEFTETLPDPLFIYNYVEKETLSIAQLVKAVSVFLNRRVPVIRVPLSLLLPSARVIQWVSGGKSPIHPARVRKAATATWVVPQALIDRGFKFQYDFAASLSDWRRRAPEDFR